MSIDAMPSPLNQLDASVLVHRVLRSGERLFAQNAPAKGLFYLISGTIDLKRVTQSGHNITIHRARSGGTFAEASIFSETYHCTATASCESVIVECGREAIGQLMSSNIEFACAMAERFAIQIQESRRRVELLSIRSAEERILMALSDGLLMEDISSLAEMIGLTPETAYRTLAKLTKSGLIVKTAHGQYTMPN